MNDDKKSFSKTTLYLTSFTAALGGLLFGFDTAVISGTTIAITKYFNLNDTMLGWAVSSALVGCLIGSITAGKPGDVFGRRAMLKVMAILFLLSALGTGLATSLTMFVAARFLGGLAIGGASVLSPMYISEIAPPNIRGRLVATSQLAIVSGILVAFFSNYLLMDTGEYSWRYMFLAGAIPAVIFFVLLFFVDQSPRWLVMVGKLEQAKATIKKLNPGSDFSKTMKEIEESLSKEAVGKSVNLFKNHFQSWYLLALPLECSTNSPV